MRKIFVIISSLLYFCSCKQGDQSMFNFSSGSASENSTLNNQKVNPTEYLQWSENPENGMIAEKTIDDLSFSAFYKTPEYLVLKEFGNGEITKPEFDKKIKDYEGMQYFSFKIQDIKDEKELLRKGLKSEQEYYSRIEYFSFKMQKDFKLIEGTDTLNCLLFHFERSYGLAPNAVFTMGFEPGKNKTSTKSILYQDNVFNVGNIYLTIKDKDLVKLPNLSI